MTASRIRSRTRMPTSRSGAPLVRVGAVDDMGYVGLAAGADYADVFVLAGRFPDYEAEAWARALFEQAAGRKGQFLWRRVLRLELIQPPRGRPLDRRTPTDGADQTNDTSPVGSYGVDSDRIAGWRVAERGEDWVRLAASGTLLSGSLVVRVKYQQILLGTTVWYNTRFGGWLWRHLAPYHRRAAPDLLGDGLAHLLGGK